MIKTEGIANYKKPEDLTNLEVSKFNQICTNKLVQHFAMQLSKIIISFRCERH